MEHDAPAILCSGEFFSISGQKLAVMFDFNRRSELAPVLLDRTDAMRANRDNLLHARLLERRQVRFGKLRECKIISKTAHGITRTALLLENTE